MAAMKRRSRPTRRRSRTPARRSSGQANVDKRPLQLGYTTIRAPIDGRTGNLLVQNGNILKANDDNPIVVINQIPSDYVPSPCRSST